MPAEREGVRREFETQVKLHINEQLYHKGYISLELYDKAKKMILKIH